MTEPTVSNGMAMIGAGAFFGMNSAIVRRREAIPGELFGASDRAQTGGADCFWRPPKPKARQQKARRGGAGQADELILGPRRSRPTRTASQ
jgi:hypothetical protein